MIQPADRLSLVQEYYFSRKLKEVAQMNAEGKDIISLAIGSPDMPPSEQTGTYIPVSLKYSSLAFTTSISALA